jgi:hypothetical protein
MAAKGDGTELQGVVQLRIEKFAELGNEAKFSPVIKIGKFPWFDLPIELIPNSTLPSLD